MMAMFRKSVRSINIHLPYFNCHCERKRRSNLLFPRRFSLWLFHRFVGRYAASSGFRLAFGVLRDPRNDRQFTHKNPRRGGRGFFAVGVRTVFYQIVCNLSRECYNAATMRYERSDDNFLCIGVRGFDYEGFLLTRLLSEDK